MKKVKKKDNNFRGYILADLAGSVITIECKDIACFHTAQGYTVIELKDGTKHIAPLDYDELWPVWINYLIEIEDNNEC